MKNWFLSPIGLFVVFVALSWLFGLVAFIIYLVIPTDKEEPGTRYTTTDFCVTGDCLLKISPQEWTTPKFDPVFFKAIQKVFPGEQIYTPDGSRPVLESDDAIGIISTPMTGKEMMQTKSKEIAAEIATNRNGVRDQLVVMIQTIDPSTTIEPGNLPTAIFILYNDRALLPPSGLSGGASNILQVQAYSPTQIVSETCLLSCTVIEEETGPPATIPA